MPKLIPVTCPSCGANVQVNPDTEVVTCEYCATSSFVQKRTLWGKPPPPPPPPPPHWGMPMRPASVIVVPNRSRSVLLAIALLTFLPVIIGLGAVTYTMWFSGGSGSGGGGESKSFDDGKPLTSDEPPSYFEDASTVSKTIQSTLGYRPKLLKLVIYPDYVSFEAQDKVEERNIDRYDLRGGTISPPDPKALHGREKTQLAQLLFDLGAVDFGVVPRMATDTLRHLGDEGAKVTHAIVRVDRGGRGPSWRVYASSDRESGSVSYDAQGRMQRVFK